MKLTILFFLGITGILFGFDKGSKRESILSSILGISLILFGFQLLKTGSVPFSELYLLKSLIKLTSNSFIYPIIIGALLRFLIHSSSTVAVLIMTISHTGIIGFNEVILMIYGTGIGEGLTVYLLSGNVKGTTRQITLFKVFESYWSSILLIGLFFIEILFDLPLVKYLVISISGTIEQQSAFIFLAFKIIPVVTLTFLYDIIYRRLLKISPPSFEEDLSKLKYINEFSMRDSETAMTMIEKEQSRIIERFPYYINHLLDNDKKSSYQVLQKANIELLSEVNYYLKIIASTNLTHNGSERFLNIQNRNNIISDLLANLFEFTSSVNFQNANQETKVMFGNLTESLHAVLETTCDTLNNSDDFNLEILLKITDDKGTLMEKIRKSFLNSSDSISSEEISKVVYVTDLYQRIIWLINKWAMKIKDSRTENF